MKRKKLRNVLLNILNVELSDDSPGMSIGLRCEASGLGIPCAPTLALSVFFASAANTRVP